jgi:hypothetical protein
MIPRIKMTQVSELITYKRTLAAYVCTFILTILLLGSSNNDTFRSIEDCVLSKIENNAALYQVGFNACKKEFERSVTIISNNSKEDEKQINSWIKEGYDKTSIYEFYANEEYGVLSEKSISRGWTRLTSNKNDRLINSLRGLFLGLGLALVVGGFYILSIRKKNE